MLMDNNFNQQKKVLLLASLISLAIHTSIFIILSATNEGERISLTPKKIKIELVEIKTKQQPKVSALKPNNQPTKNKKTPQSIPQLKPRVNKQNDSQKPKGEPAKRKRSLKIEPSVDTGSQAAKTPAVPTADTSNTRGSESVSKSSSPASSKESTSIIQKETPRCRPGCREPRIPRRLEKRGVEGYAVFRLYISASGNVLKAELLKSSGHSQWNNAARQTALSQNFYPMKQQNTLDFMYEMKSR